MIFLFGEKFKLVGKSSSWAKKWTQKEVYQVLSKIDVWNCSDFLHNKVAVV